MTKHFNLDELDSDGAIRETHEEAVYLLEKEGDTRADFLKKFGVAGTAAMGSGAVLAGLAPSAFAAGSPKASAAATTQPPYIHYRAPNVGDLGKIFGPGDFGIANYALTLEHLESAFYNQASANQSSGALKIDQRTSEFLAVVTADEADHVAYLTAAIKSLGGTPIPTPAFNFGNVNTIGDPTNPSGFPQVAYDLENTGVKAYSGQAVNIKLFAVAQAAVSILTIEARHAAVIGSILQDTGNPFFGGGIAPNGPRDVGVDAPGVIAHVLASKFITTDITTLAYPYA